MKPLPYHLQPLTVALRVRPMNHGEIRTGAMTAARSVDKNLVVLMDPNEDSDDILRANRSREKTFHFDMAFSEDATQRDVYQSTVVDRDIIGKVVSGYNCTVFAYGATGAGKTYTMLGTESDPGIMVLTLNSLFGKIEDTSNDMIYRVTMAYMEIYNEMIRDLLNPSSGILDLFEDSAGEIVVGGLLEVETSCTLEVMRLLRRGNLRRTVEPTAANKTSSRSHAILKVTVEQRDRAMDIHQEVRTGVLFMVDLAGSERAAVTQNRGKRMVEGAHINRSLLALANCINALGANPSHYVNYRDSKLTRLLKDALGGNCKTVMIAHVSPASTSFEESRNTLAYAERGKKIKNRTRQNITDVNYHITQYQHIIRELHLKIDRLQGQLGRQQSLAAATTPDSASQAFSLTTREERGKADGSKFTELCTQLKKASKEEKEIRQELFSVECQLMHIALEYQRHTSLIHDWQKKRDSIEITRKLSQELAPSVSHDSHMTNEGSTTDLSTNELKLPQVKPHPQLSALSSDEPHSISPDSGTDIDIRSNHGNIVMEPEEVSTAREEVATLVAEKHRLEARHKRMQIQLQEAKTKMMEVKESLASLPELVPVRKELIDQLQYAYELEIAGVEHNLASTLIGLQLGRHETSIEKLLDHSRQLMDVIGLQQRIMKENSVPTPFDLTQRCSELALRQDSLTAQIASERQLPPVVASGMQLPAIARFSAKFYTTMTGSKSNLFIDDTATEPDEAAGLVQSPLTLSDIHLPGLDLPHGDQNQDRLSPSVALPPLSRTEATTKVSPPKKSLKKDHSSISLPPIDTTRMPSLVAAKTVPREKEEERKREMPLHIVSKKSDTALIVEAAKKARENLIAGIPSPKKVLTKMTSFTTPRMSVSRNSSSRSKYIVPHSKTTVIDIETTGAEISGRARQDSIPCGKSHSHPHLTNNEQAKLSPSRARLSDKIGGGVAFKKSVLSEATLRRVREGRTVVTIDELNKLTRRRGKSSSIHNTPLHQRSFHHNTSDHSPHRRAAIGPSSTSLSKAGLGLSPSHHRDSPASRSLANIHKPIRSGRPAATTTVVTKTGKKITVRRALPQPPPLKRRQTPTKRQMVLSKVNAGGSLSKVTSPYLSPARAPRNKGTSKDRAAHKRTKEWI